MNYRETLNYLFTQTPVYQHDGSSAYKPGLDNVNKLATLYDNPHKHFKTVHIAGTNGKGSVSNIIASILVESGLKVGLYTSPHLIDFRERIRINGNMIPEKNVIDFVEKYLKIKPSDFEPSFFELTTILAFEWFASENIDIAVIEVGLGGRLDSTNIITPVSSVITNISFDHMALLGDSLQKIAFEKAGIIKANVPLVVGEAEDEVKQVFLNISEEKKSEIHFAQEEYYLETQNKRDSLLLNVLPNSKTTYEIIECGLTGLYQKENGATVLSLVEVLRDKGFIINDENVINGFKKVKENSGIRGRWETISLNPWIICDIGHNEAGIKYVVNQLNKTHFRHLHFVFGMVNDKDINAVLDILPKDAIYYFTKASVNRALNENILAEMAGKYGLKGKTWPTVKEAVDAAKRNCHPDDLIFVGGSNFVVAEVID